MNRSTTQRRLALRNGTTLIETLTGIAAGSMVMLTAVSLIHQSMSASDRVQRSTDRVSEIQRLAAAWREDADASRTFHAEPTLATFVTVRGATVEYRAQADSIVRTETAPADSKESNPALSRVRQETFRIAERTEVAFRTASQPDRAVLALVPKTPAMEAASGALSVEAVIYGNTWSRGGQP